MSNNPTFATRLMSGAVSMILALVSIAAVTDTAFARPAHHPVQVEREAADSDQRRADCGPARGPAHHPVRQQAGACGEREEIMFASQATIVLQ